MTKIKTGNTNITDYDVGTVSEEDWQAEWCGSFPTISIPEGFTLDQAYRYDGSARDNELNERVNVELLAALGSFPADQPFIPITIDSPEEAERSGLPTIDRVELSVGKILRPQQSCWVGQITCVDTIVITAYTSDGKIFSSPVDVAVAPGSAPENAQATSGYSGGSEFNVYLTPRGRQTVDGRFLMTLLGGMIESWGAEEQYMEEDFERQLNRYYVGLDGPTRWLRDRITEELEPLGGDWERVSYTYDGDLVVEYKDGRVVKVPAEQRGGTGRHK